MKSTVFKAEREWRLVSFEIQGELIDRSRSVPLDEGFYAVGNRIVPYRVAKYGRLPLRSILVGSKVDLGYARESLEYVLRAGGQDPCRIAVDVIGFLIFAAAAMSSNGLSSDEGDTKPPMSDGKRRSPAPAEPPIAVPSALEHGHGLRRELHGLVTGARDDARREVDLDVPSEPAELARREACGSCVGL
jgi:hypothetical protein